MKSLGTIDFSQVVAFLLPGFLALYGLGYVSSRANRLFELSFSAEGGFGVEMAILLFSLTAGIIVGAVRAVLLDGLQRLTGITRPDLDYGKLTNPETREAFRETIANRYRFAQFYGNTFVALSMFTTVRTLAPNTMDHHWLLIALIGVALVILFIQHRCELKNTYDSLKQVLS